MSLARFSDLLEQVRQQPARRRVALVEAQDRHSLEAVLRARSEGLVEPILVGPAGPIVAALEALGQDHRQVHIVPCANPEASAREAVALVKAGQAQVLMKGQLQTAELLRAVVDRATGLRLPDRIMSHVVLNEVPGFRKLLVSTDGGMVPSPDLAQKRQILWNAVDLLHRLGYPRPKVAVLAAAETVNAQVPSSLDALELKRLYLTGAITGCVVDGPISFDLAVSAEAAQIKGYQSEVAGDADILLAPDLTAGNLLGKALVYAAGARIAGLVVGASAPVVLTSRGSSSEEKYLSLALCAAWAGQP